MMACFPLVGAVTGFLYAAWFIVEFYVMCVMQKTVSARFFALGFTLIPVIVTGGIHIDGLMDTCDALGSHAPLEKKLEILKDSHSGAFAVIGCVIYFLSYFVFSCELCDYYFDAESSHKFINFFSRFMNFIPICFVFFMSRLLSAFAVATFPIAKNSGLVHTFSTASARKFTAIWCAVWFVLVSVFMICFFGIQGTAITSISLAVFAAYYFTAKRNFGGITGDTAGAFVQICELSNMLVFVILLRLYM